MEVGMITDKQVRLLMKYRQNQPALNQAAAKAGMDVKTARKYLCAGELASQIKVDHTWRTREDPFTEVWEEVKEMLKDNPGFEAKAIFDDMQRRYPSRFQDGQLRTLQRRIKVWRALEGPDKEVFFPQEHHAGELCQSDFTHLSKMNVTIDGQPFPHLLYHFVLTYSNWETGTICFSENFESLSEGLQNALWELGGVPRAHQTDRLSSAVQKVGEEDGEEFTPRYRSLLRHYRLQGRAIQAGRANENGDVEQRHHRFKRALEQAFLFRGIRDFGSREEYEAFLRKLFNQLNTGRGERLQEELKVLRRLPVRRLDDCRRVKVRVGSSSTIHVLHNTYTVSSRLIGERVEARVYAKHLEIWYAQRCTETMPRLRGEKKHRIDYRHIIGWLVRKPGAFANYRYRSELFPSSQFRMAYDALKEQSPSRADRDYLAILHLAALEGESRVEAILRRRLKEEKSLDAKSIQALLKESAGSVPVPTAVEIAPVDLSVYDRLMDEEVSAWVH
jgi:hypothetical protein